MSSGNKTDRRLTSESQDPRGLQLCQELPGRGDYRNQCCNETSVRKLLAAREHGVALRLHYLNVIKCDGCPEQGPESCPDRMRLSDEKRDYVIEGKGRGEAGREKHQGCSWTYRPYGGSEVYWGHE